ncbi:DgyrCDS3298 [Dimorphilus gyrociliatus]|uniref:DgyrCDS3298 n=1 Tax=Dimorphilus gyrociliatus TaxID=2664684 RepID=A0A7I8VDB9_9ANNE|nr:DgyrCDS3298 [Dimorphilus gyrociliatus]
MLNNFKTIQQTLKNNIDNLFEIITDHEDSPTKTIYCHKQQTIYEDFRSFNSKFAISSSNRRPNTCTIIINIDRTFKSIIELQFYDINIQNTPGCTSEKLTFTDDSNSVSFCQYEESNNNNDNLVPTNLFSIQKPKLNKIYEIKPNGSLVIQFITREFTQSNFSLLAKFKTPAFECEKSPDISPIVKCQDHSRETINFDCTGQVYVISTNGTYRSDENCKVLLNTQCVQTGTFFFAFESFDVEGNRICSYDKLIIESENIDHIFCGKGGNEDISFERNGTITHHSVRLNSPYSIKSVKSVSVNFISDSNVEKRGIVMKTWFQAGGTEEDTTTSTVPTTTSTVPTTTSTVPTTTSENLVTTQQNNNNSPLLHCRWGSRHNIKLDCSGINYTLSSNASYTYPRRLLMPHTYVGVNLDTEYYLDIDRTLTIFFKTDGSYHFRGFEIQANFNCDKAVPSTVKPKAETTVSEVESTKPEEMTTEYITRANRETRGNRERSTRGNRERSTGAPWKTTNQRYFKSSPKATTSINDYTTMPNYPTTSVKTTKPTRDNDTVIECKRDMVLDRSTLCNKSISIVSMNYPNNHPSGYSCRVYFDTQMENPEEAYIKFTELYADSGSSRLFISFNAELDSIYYNMRSK